MLSVTNAMCNLYVWTTRVKGTWSLHDAVMIVKRAVKNGEVVAGACLIVSVDETVRNPQSEAVSCLSRCAVSSIAYYSANLCRQTLAPERHPVLHNERCGGGVGAEFHGNELAALVRYLRCFINEVVFTRTPLLRTCLELMLSSGVGIVRGHHGVWQAYSSNTYRRAEGGILSWFKSDLGIASLGMHRQAQCSITTGPLQLPILPRLR
jgi:hypothetical protein